MTVFVAETLAEHTWYLEIEALHGEVLTYFWFAVTPCVYTCQVEFVLRELFFFILLSQLICHWVYLILLC